MGCNAGNGFDAANNHYRDRGRDHQAKQPALVGKKALLSSGDSDKLHIGLVRLEHVAYAQTTNDQRQGVETTQELAPTGGTTVCQVTLQVIHGTTGHRAIRIIAPVFHTQGTFNQLGGHR